MSTSLQIQLNDPRRVYSPGDSLTGNVVFTTSPDRAVGSVQIILLGRAKTKMVQHRGQNRRVYRGRANLFRIGDISFEINRTRKSGTFVWPFSFTIPEHPIAGQVGWQWKQEGSYLSSSADTSKIPLPSTFSVNGHGIGSRFHARTDYSIQVEVVEPANSSMFSRRTSTKALYPFHLISTHPARTPICDFDLRVSQSTDRIRTLRLLPEYVNAKLTIGERTKSIFRPSTLPSFAFDFTVTTPNVLQVGNPSPVPLLIAVKARANGSTINLDNPPRMRLISFRLAIKSHTTARAQGSIWEHHDNTADTVELCRMTLAQDNPIFSNSHDLKCQDDSSSLQLDLGEIFNVRLRPGLLCPSFATYNIVHYHSMIYKLAFECAGENVKFDLQGLPVKIYGPSAGSVHEDGVSMYPLPSYDELDSDNEDVTPESQEYNNGSEKQESKTHADGQEAILGAFDADLDGHEMLPEYKP